MRMIARAHTSRRATSLMRLKNSTRTTNVYDAYCLGHWNEES